MCKDRLVEENVPTTDPNGAGEETDKENSQVLVGGTHSPKNSLPANQKEESPFDSAGCISRAIFMWLSPFVYGVANGTYSKQNFDHGGVTAVAIANPKKTMSSSNSTPPLPERAVPQNVLARFDKELERIRKQQHRQQHLKQKNKAHGSSSSTTAPQQSGSKLVLRALYGVYKKDLLIIVLFQTMAGLCWLLIPAFWIRNLVIFSQQDTTTTSAAFGFAYALGLMGTELLRSLCIQNFWYKASEMACEIKSLIYALVFTRSLHLRGNNTSSPNNHNSVSQLMSLCTNDGERLFECVRTIPTIYVGTFLLTGIGILSTYILGVAALAGILVVLLLLPIQYFFSKFIGKTRKRGYKCTNERITIMTELLNDIKLIKMYHWETAFTEKIYAIRQQEQTYLKPASYLSSFVQSLSYVLPTLSAVTVLIVHVEVRKKSLSAQDAFAIVGLFNNMIMPISMFPITIRALSEGKVGLHHLGQLLLSNMTTTTTTNDNNNVQFISHSPPLDTSVAIEIKNGNFGWGGSSHSSTTNHNPTPVDELKVETTTDGQPPPQPQTGSSSSSSSSLLVASSDLASPTTPSSSLLLSNVNIRIQKGELIGVCGTVGSGKSSLCNLIMGSSNIQSSFASTTTTTTTGKSEINVCTKSIAYVSQVAWILPTTIKENILFGSEYNEQKYMQIVKACCLDTDFVSLRPLGDETMIGERGVNLSGGQKQRIALARAVYSNRSIYILDDPLSAVDAKVGKHIFNECILQLLKNNNNDKEQEDKKTIFFVTHNTQYLPGCDRVVFIDNGLTYMDTYNGLISNNESFHKFISHLKVEEVEKPSSSSSSSSTTSTKKKEKKKKKKMRDTSTTMDPKNNANEQQQLQLQQQKDNSIPPMNISSHHDNEIEIVAESITGEKHHDDKNNNSNQIHHNDTDYDDNYDTDDAQSRATTITTTTTDHHDNKFHWSTVRAFGQAGDGLFLFLIIFVLFLVATAGKVFTDRWLAYWISKGDGAGGDNMSMNPQRKFYVTVYGVAAMSFLLLQGFRGYCYNKYMLNASTKAHNKLIKVLMNAPLWFYDTKPIGQILSRVSKDMDEIDVRVPIVLEQFIIFSSVIILTLILISVIFPWFICGLPFIGILYIYVVKKFKPAQFYSKQVENEGAAPVLSHMVASLEGISIIHAFEAQQMTINEFWLRFDELARGLFYFFGVQAWAAYRLDLVSFSIVSITAVLVPLLHGKVAPGLTGLALVYANGLGGLWQATTRMGAEVAARITSIERIVDYINNVPAEPNPLTMATTTSDKNNNTTTLPTIIPKDWPTKGEIRFENLSASYRPGLPNVLHDVSILIPSGQKIGVVGRTGSGKSTLSLCLFRLIGNLQGNIYIDDIETSIVPLNRLRLSLGIIPQDPVLFTGTIRYNLDPFGLYKNNDDALWSALQRAHVKTAIEELPDELDTVVDAGGSNFSVGERQLLCMARALLRDCKIMLLDEATSAIDSRTDELIQKTIRTEFSNCTVLTIAHRIDTIIDADRILVLEKGHIVEFDTPENLMKHSESIFKGLVDSSAALKDPTAENIEKASSKTPN